MFNTNPNDLSRENQKTIKEGSTTFYRREANGVCGYDVKYRNGYGIKFSNGDGKWNGYLIEKTDNGWRPCYKSPLVEGNVSYSNLTDEAIVELCNRLREC